MLEQTCPVEGAVKLDKFVSMCKTKGEEWQEFSAISKLWKYLGSKDGKGRKRSVNSLIPVPKKPPVF